MFGHLIHLKFILFLEHTVSCWVPVESRPVGFVNPSDVAIVRHPGLNLFSSFILFIRVKQIRIDFGGASLRKDMVPRKGTLKTSFECAPIIDKPWHLHLHLSPECAGPPYYFI